MKLYTSYWAMVRNFPKTLIGLNTTCWPPKYRPLGQDKNGIWVIDCPIVKPGIECAGLCDGKCSPKHPKDCSFLKTYSRQLDKIDFNDFISSLKNLYNKIKIGENLVDLDFAFIFYEAPLNQCSERWPLINWIQSHNFEIVEWHK